MRRFVDHGCTTFGGFRREVLERLLRRQSEMDIAIHTERVQHRVGEQILKLFQRIRFGRWHYSSAVLEHCMAMVQVDHQGIARRTEAHLKRALEVIRFLVNLLRNAERATHGDILVVCSYKPLTHQVEDKLNVTAVTLEKMLCRDAPYVILFIPDQQLKFVSWMANKDFWYEQALVGFRGVIVAADFNAINSQLGRVDVRRQVRGVVRSLIWLGSNRSPQYVAKYHFTRNNQLFRVDNNEPAFWVSRDNNYQHWLRFGLS